MLRAEEERKLRGKLVDFQSGLERISNILNGIGDRECDLLNGGGASFANVIAGNGNGVVARKMVFGKGEDIGDQAHRRLRRIDIRPACDEFFEDVVLDRAGDLIRRNSLFLGDSNVHAKQDRCGGIDGH